MISSTLVSLARFILTGLDFPFITIFSFNIIGLRKAFTFVMKQYFGVMLLDVKLFVDGEEIDLNEFVVKILSGTLVGAVTSLRGVKKNWKEIEVKVTR